MSIKIDTHPATAVTIINDKVEKGLFIVSIQTLSFSEKRLFYVFLCTPRYHLSQKVLISGRYGGNAPEAVTFSTDGGSRHLVRRSSVQWQG